LSDLDQLELLREAPWPKSSAEEHAEELRLMLAGKAALTTPITILVAEASDGTLVGFLEVDLRSHGDGCNPSRPVGYVEATSAYFNTS
jgi:aminoglycoside 6'-N-acetyltransferase I